MPRAPALLSAAESSRLSAIAWALNTLQSYPAPKYRLLYFLKWTSYPDTTRGVWLAVRGAGTAPPRIAARSSAAGLNSVPAR